MKRAYRVSMVFGIFLMTVSFIHPSFLNQIDSENGKFSLTSEEFTQSRAQLAYGRLPLNLIENEGQVDNRVKLYEKGSGHATFFTPEGIYLGLSDGSRKSAHLKLIPLGANKHPEIVAEGLQEGRVNYFIGKDPTKWKTNIPTYHAAVYKEVYPGIDMKFYGNNRQLEYDIVVKPGADPSKIRLAYEGIEALKVTEKGDLEIGLKDGKILQRRPQVYQEINGKRIGVDGKFKIRDSKFAPGFTYGFEVAAYDKNYPVIIDPTLLYSTYLGGLGWDTGYGIAVDGSGDAYVTGHTNSPYFPTTPGAYDTTCGTDGLCNGDFDAFVVKLNPTGTGLLYATYIGGSGTDAFFGGKIAVDASGNAYVTGHTNSTDFPTTPGAFDATCGTDGLCNGGLYDIYIAKLDPTGSLLLYSSYLGGSGNDHDPIIAVDEAGYAYVSGSTNSSDLPTTPGAFQTTNPGGAPTVFTAKLDTTAAGTASLIYCTYGFGDTDALAVDGSGNAYSGLAKLNATGSSLVYSISLAANSSYSVRGVAVDAAGNAYVTGEVSNLDPEAPPALLTTSNAFDTTFNGGPRDAFVAKLDPNGAILYSTYLGGSDDDTGRAIAVDSWGNAYITGYVTSTNYPTTAGSIDTTFNGGFDSFLSMVNPDAAGSASLRYSAYLGGTNSEFGYAIAVGASNAYLTGQTGSGDFPTTPGAFDTSLNDPVGGNSDASVSKVAFPDLVITAVSPNSGTVNAGSTLSVTDTTQNQGEGSTSGTFRISYHLSTDSIYGNADDVAIATYRTAATLAGGGSNTASTNLTIPTTTPANTYYVCALADSLNSVVEPNETNNTLCSSARVTVPPPDLIVSALSTTATTVNAGATVSLTNSITNQGGSRAVSFVTAFHLSTNTVYGDGDDIASVTTRTISALNAGATNTATTSVTIPAATPAGIYYLCAKTDSTNTVAESDETDNTRCTSTTVTVPAPDLVMTALSKTASSVAAGKSFSISNTVKNQGGSQALGFAIGFVLSPNNTVGDGDDVALTPQRSVAVLNVNASSAATTTVTVPVGTAPGVYYVGAIADVNNAVTESNEANNTRLATSTITVTP